MQALCSYMDIQRGSYYKWCKNQGLKGYQQSRLELISLCKKIHQDKPSYGYRRINYVIKKQTGWVISNIQVHKCCKYLNIKSQVKRYRYQKVKSEHLLYPNIIKNNWQTTKPLQKIVSDMTNIWFHGKRYELTFYLDTFNNEILSYQYSSNKGDPNPYYKGLEEILKQTKSIAHPIYLHTDQGSVYASQMFNNIHKNYNIIRSMSRVATPTDNPIIESINGWIKEEMFIDFNQDDFKNIQDFLDMFIGYFNNERPSSKLNYKTPLEYKTLMGF